MCNKYKPFDVQSKEVHKTIVYLYMKRTENKGNSNTQREKKETKLTFHWVNPLGLLTQFKCLTSDDIFYSNFHTFCDVFIRLLWLADQPQAQKSTTAINHQRSCLKACNHSTKGLVYKGSSFWVLVYSSHLLK